ncbi:MAG: SUMF1/EgtB/PvdO family nonheme iron enzyme [Labilithrix sp.]|nr:SUMF1/EgtB/PvdO family nonheme iron enzyme [Labilithrix sp.]MCW5815908.1 SUMF1/EgtB/PvdO family nonheme iron enzyme [Labilithrix sp.]
MTFAVFVASCSLFTSNTVEGGRGPCPAGMVHIDLDGAPRGYCIDKYEASVVEIRGKEEVAHAPYEPVTNLKVKAVSRAGAVPQGYISKNEAEAACVAAKKRLCTAVEWQTACRGRKPTKFPYGDERKDGYCNDSGRAPLAALHPELPGDEVYSSHAALNDPRINRAPNTVAPAGKFDKCKNAYGVFDMVGNLHEWTAEVNGSRGVFRGGYYQDTHLNGDGCGYKTDAHGLSYHDYSTGFRCCANPR